MSLETKVTTLLNQSPTSLPRGIKNAIRLFLLMNKFSFTMLNPKNTNLKMAPPLVPDCHACDKNCCSGSGNQVTLRLKDIARLIDNNKEHYIDVKNKPQLELKKYRFWERFHRRKDQEFLNIFPKLKQKDDGTCIFLTEDKKCSIHTIRPLVCRSFPYSLEQSLREITFSLSCSTFKKAENETDEKLVKQLFNDTITNYNEKIDDLIAVFLYPHELNKIGVQKYISYPYWFPKFLQS
ncbi:YkgJ family cysteine cluster protein [Candidatus Margulisiibacteriota bacterium]